MKTHLVLAACTALLLACAEDSPEKHVAAAKLHFEKGDYKATAIEAKTALQKNPEQGEARFLLAQALLEDGNPVAAEVEFRKALAAKHPAAEVVPGLAQALLAIGKSKVIVDEFGQTRLGNPAADARLQTTLSIAFATLGKDDQAKAALEAALKADPQNSSARLLSAWRMAGARNIDGAMAVVEEVLSIEPANAEAWQMKGDLLLYGKRLPEEALVAYRKSAEADPRRPAGLLAVVDLLLRQGKIDEAAKELAELKKIAPRNPRVLVADAIVAYQLKDYKRAREVSQQLLRFGASNPQVLQIAGATELQLGALAQAEVLLAKALQLAPTLEIARRLLITTHLRAGQPAKALAELNAAAGKGDLPPSMYSLAGEVYLQNGDIKRAEELFSKALKLDPDDSRKRTALALAHLASGQSAALDELQDIAGADSGVTADLALVSASLGKKDFDRALAALDRLEAKQPNKPLAANLRGRVYLARNDTASARKSFERALSIDPKYFAAAVSLARLDVAEKRPAEARKRFEALLDSDPKNASALVALAQLYSADRADRDKVRSLLGRAIEAAPAEVVPRLMLIEIYLRDRDTKQALATAQNAVAALPSSPELLAALGRVQQVSGDANQAMATFSKAVQLQPMSPQSYVRLAEAQVAGKSMAAAEHSLRKALELRPDDLDAQRMLLAVLVEAKRYPEAIKLAKQVQTQRPRQAFGWVFEGEVAVSRKDWDAAIAAFRVGLQQVQAPVLAMKLHAALKAAGKEAEASRQAAIWLGAHPKDAAFLDYMAAEALARKEYVEAQRYYAALARLQPDNAAAFNNLAWAEQQIGTASALQHAQRAHELAPDQPAFMDTLAMILSARGEHDKAVALQLKAVEKVPTDQGLKLSLARIYLAAGDKAKARSELEVLTKLDEKHPARREAQALLAKM
ncbi:MAG: PEP-CTERM system TPR-repeat protein PrsT [Burkholderiales bacterium]|nr:PEP-CTERM system TPR-repeat protein PrsT [Burkholderiales bacterium]